MAKDLLARLADAGEGAISKLGESSRLDRVTGLVNSTRERLDDLTRRVRGLEALEQRVEQLEQRLDELSATPKGKSTRASSAKSGSGAAKATAEKKKPAEAEEGSSAKTGGDSPG